jgi:AraC-like DNA-binding protein
VRRDAAERVRRDAACPWREAGDRHTPHRATRSFAGPDDLAALGSHTRSPADARAFRQNVQHARYGGLEISLDHVTPHSHTWHGTNFRHNHPLTRLAILLDGRQQVAIDGQHHVMERGSGFLVPGDRTVTIEALTPVARLHIDIPMPDEEFAPSLAHVGLGYWPPNTAALEALGAFVGALLARTRDSDSWPDRIAVRRMIKALLLTTIPGAPPFASPDVAPSGYRELALRLIEHQHTDSSLTPEKVAQRLGLSLRTVQRAFADDCSMSEWITQARIDHALSILGDQQYATLSVHDIAGRAGFPSAAIFRRAIKNATGLTPVEYRSQRGG